MVVGEGMRGAEETEGEGRRRRGGERQGGTKQLVDFKNYASSFCIGGRCVQGCFC